MTDFAINDPSQYAADWRIVQSQVAAGNLAWVPIVQANPKRIALFFMMSGVGAGQWTTDNTLPVSSGFNLPQGGSAIAERLNYNSYGGLCQATIYAIGAGGPITVEVCEILWNPTGGH